MNSRCTVINPSTVRASVPIHFSKLSNQLKEGSQEDPPCVNKVVSPTLARVSLAFPGIWHFDEEIAVLVLLGT